MPSISVGTRIAHVATDDFFVRFLLHDQLVSLSTAGFDVTVISSLEAGAPLSGNRVFRQTCIPMTRRISPFRDIVSLYRLYTVFRTERFRIVHTHTPKANLVGQIAARLASVPVRVSTVHGLYFAGRSRGVWHIFYRLIEKISARYAQRVFLINPEDVELAERYKICDSRKIRLLNYGIGVNLDRFDRSKVAADTTRMKQEELGIKNGSPVVGFVGRLVAEKGLRELFAAIRIVARLISEVQLLCVGPVDAQKGDAITPQVAAEYGIYERCIFAGMRTDLPELYTLMNVVILPSHREGFGLVLAEAAAMGIPVIATNISGCRHAVEEGRNGLLVSVGDVKGLAEAIVTILKDPLKSRRMGSEGQVLARERFDQQLAFRRIQQEYMELISQETLEQQ